jgi:hypothetical protein
MHVRPEISKRRCGLLGAVFSGLAALALTAACDRPPDDERVVTGGDETLAPEPAPEAGVPDLPERELPDPGSAVVSVVGGKCTVLANSVDRLELLHRVSEAAGFRVVVEELASGPVTVRAVEVAAEEAVALVLEGVPYEIDFGFDPEAQSYVLDAVTAGESGELSEGASALRGRRPAPRRNERLSAEERERRRAERLAKLPPEEQERLRRRREALLAALSPEDRERFLEEGRARVRIGALSPERREEIREKRREILRERRERAARRLQYRAQQRARRESTPEAREPSAPVAERLSDPDPDVRAGAVSDLPVNPETVVHLREILEADPDPGVRAEAARQLAFADSFRAGSSLVYALGDRDPGVVIAAIEALEFVGDPSVVPELRALSAHPDQGVRRRAAGAVEFLK